MLLQRLHVWRLSQDPNIALESQAYGVWTRTLTMPQAAKFQETHNLFFLSDLVLSSTVGPLEALVPCPLHAMCTISTPSDVAQALFIGLILSTERIRRLVVRRSCSIFGHLQRGRLLNHLNNGLRKGGLGQKERSF